MSTAVLPATLLHVERKIRKILGHRIHSVIEEYKPKGINGELSLDLFETYKRQR